MDDLAGFANNPAVQCFPQATLGDGQPATLYYCADSRLSGTLRPLSSQQPSQPVPPAEFSANDRAVVAEHPIASIALDEVEGLERLDALLLSASSDVMTILAHGARALQNTLLLEIELAEPPTHQGQATQAAPGRDNRAQLRAKP